ncbi:hypothetical protein H4R18_001009 [Coemansia javaensis]|uniref:Uncharacterized protein n=1 Tax=Coemansia javaensis TaxID=2761396 RepID=A0A9W8LJT2_9FUNG|nr:hypothetical protein H4R18_001009 [Coemansia javaensis]
MVSFDESVYDSPYEDPNKGDSEEYELVKSNPSDSDSTNGSQSDPEKIGDDMFDPDLIDDVLPAIKLSKSEETDNETVGG